MYIQIFYKKLFFEEKFNSQPPRLIIHQTKKETRYFKQGRYLDKTNDKSGIYCKKLIDKVLTFYLFIYFLREANIPSDIISLPLACICSNFDGISSPLSANLVIECPFMWCVRFSKYFCSILTNTIEYEASHKSPVLIKTKKLS